MISPWRANLDMHRYLQAFRHAGLDRRDGVRLVNYADDFVVRCRQGAAELLAQTWQWFQQMGLTLHEQKTRRCNGRHEPFTCLGYTLGPMVYRNDGQGYLGAAPATKAVQRIKCRIRQILGSGNQAPWEDVVMPLNPVWRGWAAYCSYGTRLMAYWAVEQYVAQRVRHCLRRRHQVPTRGTRRDPSERVFGELGVFHLRRVHLGSAAHAWV